ncbi:MAG TPA: MOSC domain-containing protein [Intrasporangiaceae bacterium]|nr:MOSC domain-containing protein [Intrasporangiaceae bacterium]
MARVRSTNVAVPKPEPAGQQYLTGIDKRPVPHLAVFAPAGGYGHGSGVDGDHVGDSAHHGGREKAVYLFAREELDFWERDLGRTLADGTFGENLTTEGIDLERLRLNQRLRVGEQVVLEVSVPRSPCRTFQEHLGVGGWVKRFAAHGRCGIYTRVVMPGTIAAGDPIELVGTPGHDIDMITAFASAMGDNDAAARVVAAECLPAMYHERLVRRLAAR